NHAEELRGARGRITEEVPPDHFWLDRLYPVEELDSGLGVPELVNEDPQGCGDAEDADRQQGHRRLAGPQQADGGTRPRRHEREELEADVGQVVEELGRSCVLPLDALGHPSPYGAGNEPPARAPEPGSDLEEQGVA